MKQWETMGVQLSECDQVNVAKWKQPGEYNQWWDKENVTNLMYLTECNLINEMKWMHESKYIQVSAPN